MKTIDGVNLENCCVCESDDLYIDEFNGKFQVVCKNCTSSTSSYEDKEYAIVNWNRMSRIYRRKH